MRAPFKIYAGYVAARRYNTPETATRFIDNIECSRQRRSRKYIERSYPYDGVTIFTFPKAVLTCVMTRQYDLVVHVERRNNV